MADNTHAKRTSSFFTLELRKPSTAQQWLVVIQTKNQQKWQVNEYRGCEVKEESERPAAARIQTQHTSGLSRQCSATAFSIGAGTGLDGPAMARPFSAKVETILRSTFVWSRCQTKFRHRALGHVRKCARIRLTFSMAKLPYLHAWRTSPAGVIPFPKEKRSARRR